MNEDTNAYGTRMRRGKVSHRNIYQQIQRHMVTGDTKMITKRKGGGQREEEEE